MKVTTFLTSSFMVLQLSLQAHTISADSLHQLTTTLSGEQQIDALNTHAITLLDVNNGVAAGRFAREARDLAQEMSYQKGLAQAFDNQGFVFEDKYDYTNAMKAFVGALKVRNDMRDEAGIALSKNNIGKIFFLQEDYVQAEENLMRALDWREKNGDQKGMAETHLNLGNLFLAKEIYGKAQEHFRKALDAKLQLEDIEGAAQIARRTGQVASDLGDYDGALIYHQMTLDLHSSLEDVPSIAEDFNNMVLTLMAQGEYEEAEEVNQQAWDIRSELNNTIGQAESAKNFGVIYTALNQSSEAITWLEKSADLLTKVKSHPNKPLIYKDLSVVFQKSGDFKSAYQNHVSFAESRTALLNEEKSRALLELTTKYESEFAAEQQQQQIAQLEKEQTAANRFRMVLFAVIGLIGLLLVNVFRSYQTKKKDNELLLAKNEEIRFRKEEVANKNKALAETNSRLDVLNTKLVDEIAEREAIEKSSFERDRFLATMSHEMRTPINIIVGLTHLLLDENPREDQIEHLRTLQFSANNLVVFINDVLDFSQIEANKLNLEKREFGPQKTFNEIRQRFNIPAQKKNIVIKYDYDHKIPETLWGDPVRFNQIITNLLTASMESTSEGKIHVGFQLHQLNPREATLELQISDNGNGISQADLEKVLSNSTSLNQEDVFEGYGTTEIGLAITKRLIELQNGQIDVETAEGIGTTFTVLLPFQILTQKELKPTKSSPKDYTNLESSRILLVEDNKINQLVVAKMLRKVGVTIVTADDGLQAVEAFSKEDFDLILMDIQMPNMDGYRATAEIRKHPNPDKRDTPIIALTASAFLTEKEKAKLFGMNDHVGKPFSPEELMEKIYACLRVKA